MRPTVCEEDGETADGLVFGLIGLTFGGGGSQVSSLCFLGEGRGENGQTLPDATFK